MNHFSKLLLLLFSTLVLLSCKKENEDVTNDTGNNTENNYTQYGIPLENVPKTEDIIMYEVNLRAFSENGDLQGVINKLDHIESLGVNVIWLMPIHPVGEVNSVNSPYSVKDFKAVGSEYGTLADLRALTDAAHAKGIAVILDWVANHTAWDHEWTSAHKNWYTQDANGNIIHPLGTNWLDVADLNFDNFDMRAAMIDAMQYWVYEANVDGFRCDHADGVPFDFWQQAIQSIRSIPNRDLIFFAEGARNDHFAAGFDLNFGWQYYDAIKNTFNGQAASITFNAHNNEYNNLSANKHWVRFTTNHDESAWDATPISLFNGNNGALAASVATIFTGGVPLIYGSQEVGAVNPIPFFSNSLINWNANASLLESYRKILQFYAQNKAARVGINTVFFNSDVICIRKSHNGQSVLILVNTRNNTVNYNISSSLQNISWYNVISESNISLNSQISLAPYQFYILTQ